MGGRLQLSKHTLGGGHDLSPLDAWRAVFAADPSAGPFVSPAWVRAWCLRYVTAPHTAVLLVGADSAGVPRGACLLTSSELRRGGLRWRRLHLNTDGLAEEHSAAVEHNRILASAGYANAMARLVAEHVRATETDALHLAGVDPDQLARLTAALPEWTVDVEWRDAPFVDLEQLRRSGQPHGEAVGASTRRLLRQTLRGYGGRGAVAVEEATSDAERLAWMDELEQLHTARWEARGSAGAFASPVRRQFLRHLLSASPEAVRLLRARSARETIGVLYLLSANERVSFYQGGFAYGREAWRRPGLLTHHLAIEYLRTQAAATVSEYDFLASAGEAVRYKQALATGTRQIGWARLTRPGVRRDALRAMQRVWRRLSGRRTAPSVPLSIST